MTLNTPSTNSPTPLSSTHLAPQKLHRAPSKLRRYLSTRKPNHTHTPPSQLPPNTSPAGPAPLQTLSPRPTASNPQAKKLVKRSLSTFLVRKPRTKTGESSTSEGEQGCVRVVKTADSTQMPDEERLGGGARLPDVSTPGRVQMRKDSVVKMGSVGLRLPARDAALTSHPVGREDLEDEEFQTPGEFEVCQKEDYMDK